MSAASLDGPVTRLMTRRQARRLLVAMHVPFIAFVVGVSVTGLGFLPPGDGLLVLPLALAVGGIQLRHSLAAASGVRPRHWRWTLLLLVVIAYAPLVLFPEFELRWRTVQWFVLASYLMLLPGRMAAVAVGATLIGWSGWIAVDGLSTGRNPAQLAWLIAYAVTVNATGAGCLYGAVRLVQFIDELRDARASLAELAIGRERLRISRDLHDLLGQTLSAVSLKGDLAIRLLGRNDVPRAAAEIESLISVARSALHDLREVAHREPPISLSTEVERAADLLAAAGIRTRMEISAEGQAPPVDDLLGWALREGVTNVLRHSTATTCSITIRRDDGRVRLAIENDGATAPSAGGSGLTGLMARAAALSGSAVGRPVGDGRFRLLVEIPEVGT